MQVAGLILDATYGKKEKHVVRTRPAWLSEDD
jgi:hypothetical protein